jgi:uncharacterized membrane protein
MLLANITDYSVGLFIHIVAVVLTFGPTFGYGFLFAVLPRYPRAAPGLIAGMQKIDRYLITPGMLVILLAGIYLLVEGPWESSDLFVTVGFVAIIALFGLQHGFFRPQEAKARELAERDLKAGDALSAEFEEVSRRLGTVGPIAGLIIVVTIFFMTVKP